MHYWLIISFAHPQIIEKLSKYTFPIWMDIWLTHRSNKMKKKGMLQVKILRFSEKSLGELKFTAKIQSLWVWAEGTLKRSQMGISEGFSYYWDQMEWENL